MEILRPGDKYISGDFEYTEPDKHSEDKIVDVNYFTIENFNIDIRKYELSIPDHCALRTYSEHLKKNFCWGILIRNEERNDITNDQIKCYCQHATRKISNA